MSFSLTGCKNDPETKIILLPPDDIGKLIILQAYSSSDSALGASHSFVELYNSSASAINLNGINLYYADGHRSTDVGYDDDQDKPWKKIELSGTIPSKASFLVLGPKQNLRSAGTNGASTYQIPDGYGDINDPEFTLYNRAFKVALIKGNTNISDIQNPFNTDGNGTKVSGYLDMVGATNSAPDKLFGFETAPARCSASQAVRRIDLMDTDDNSEDFDEARYNGMGVLEFAQKAPRNLSAGAWNPFAPQGTYNPPPGGPGAGSFVEAGAQDALAGQLLILQAYGPNAGAAGASHPFVELYNNTNAPINLSGINLYFADGTRNTSGSSGSPGPVATEDGPWKKIALNGTIPAKGSFLVLGPYTSSSGRLQITNNYGDINDDNFVLSNRAYKIAIIRTSAENGLNVQNPFTMDGGGIAAGYIDMVGAANTYGSGHNDDMIYGFEGAPARCSASEAVRRKDLTDTNNNSVDFIAARYGSGTGTLTNEEVVVRRPRNSTDTAAGWNPFAEPAPPSWPVGTAKLMILQANTHGNDNNGPAGFLKSLVELYNNTNTPINLTAGNYYLHIGNATTWQVSIKLEGTIPAYSSFLIISNNAESNATAGRAPLPAADQLGDFVINNTNFKIALVRNLSTLSDANPFTAGLGVDYIDMLGTGTANGFEGAVASASRPQGPRRTSLTDTDNNGADFAQANFRGYTNNTTGVPDSELHKIWPRNSAAGAWNPITGESVTP